MPDVTLSGLGRLNRAVYSALCGQSPRERPWHFQWLSTLPLHRRLSRLAPNYGGRVLHVRCGEKTYRTWFGEVHEYIDVDIALAPDVDVVIAPDERWSLLDQCYDVLLSTQVVEHVENLGFALNGMMRVLKPSSVVILSFPFLHNVHGGPNDFRRFTHFGARKLLPGCEVLHMETQGGIGSTLVIQFPMWVDTALSRNSITRVFKGLLLPLFIPLSFLLNLLGMGLDSLDRTTSNYSNILLVARKVTGTGLPR